MEKEFLLYKRVADSINDDIVHKLRPNGGNDDIGIYPRLTLGYLYDIGFFFEFGEKFIIYDEENDGHEIENDWSEEKKELWLNEELRSKIRSYSRTYLKLINI